MSATRALILAILIGTADTASFAEDVPLSTIDTNRLTQVLPKDWTICSVEVVPAPKSWRTVTGDRGVRVTFANTNLIIKHFAVSYNPRYWFMLMPTNWEGTNILGQSFVNGQVVLPTIEGVFRPQFYPDRYVGLEKGYYFFESYIGHYTWENPYQSLKPVLTIKVKE